MPIYYVYVPEVHYSKMKVEANSPEEAQELVNNGEGEQDSLHYHTTLDRIQYEIEDENRNTVQEEE